jgi:hypothetical protein
MDTINVKLAIPYLKNLIIETVIRNNTRFYKKQLAKQNHFYSKIFYNRDQNKPQSNWPFWEITYSWVWKKKDENKWSNCPFEPGDRPERSGAESLTEYDIRCQQWIEYTKLSGSNSIPKYCDWKDTELSCLHIIYNRLRCTKPHTKDDSRYESLQFYKDMLQRLEILFPVLPVTPEVLSENSGLG